MKVRLKLSTPLGLLLVQLLLSPVISRADYTNTISPQTTWGVWEGWGVSLCWWANVFGTRDDLADLMFTTNYTVLNGTNLPGLALNMARYNAGACSWNSISGESMVVASSMNPDRQIPGFWLDWNSQDPASTNWDWTVDMNQRSMLLKAKARGANVFELFSNSPMWWMCYNHNPCGNGGSDNLQWWNYDNHAFYLSTIAKYAQDNWGITFNSVEPFNEPLAPWWVANGTQEGCHYDRSTQATVAGSLRSELDAHGLTSVIVAASDEFKYDDATGTWDSFSSDVKAKIGRVNVHGYQYGGGRRDWLYADVSPYGAHLWTSEYADTDTSGVSLAYCLNLDFRWMRLNGWCYWQPLDTGSYGLIQSNLGDRWIGPANTKYYVLAHYTRHIRNGMTILDGFQDDTVVAHDAAKRKLVLVTMNYGTAQTITYNLTNFYRAAGPVTRWMTVTGTNIAYAQFNDTVISNRTFRASFPANTIQTFEIQNVDLYPPPQLSISPTVDPGLLTLSWPTTAAGYQLYATANLASGGSWELITNTAAISNNNYYVIMPATNDNRRLFRLANP